MIIYSDLAGNVSTVPSSVPMGSALNDIVVVVPQIHATCVLKIKPPNQEYLPDIVCKSEIQKGDNTLIFSAKLPKAVTKMMGRAEYQLLLIDADGKGIASEMGSFNVSRGVPVDMPDNVDELGEWSLQNLYEALTAVTAANGEIANINGLIGEGDLSTASKTIIAAINEVKALIDGGASAGGGNIVVPPNMEDGESGLVGLANTTYRELQQHIKGATKEFDNIKQKQETDGQKIDEQGADIERIDKEIESVNKIDEAQDQEIVSVKQRLATTEQTANTARDRATTNANNLANISAQLKGVGRTYVVNTFTDFINFIQGSKSITLYEDRNGDGQVESYSVNSSDLKTGDNINIKEENVPDFWIALTTNASDAEDFEYNGTTYSLKVLYGGSMRGAAYINETDYTIINEQAISAAASASAAAASAKDAASNAILAESYKNAADTSARQAAASANTAKEDASNAQKSAQQAANSASAASAANTNANNAASRANASAGVAESKANIATSEALRAQESAQEAADALEEIREIAGGIGGVSRDEFNALERRVEAIEQEGGGGGTGGTVFVDATLTMEGEAADAKATGDRIRTIEAAIADLTYEPINITSFTLTGEGFNADNSAIVIFANPAELGQEVIKPTAKWSLDREAKKIVLSSTNSTFGTIDVTGRTQYTTSINTQFAIKTDTKFTLTATDERGTETKLDKWLYFYNGVYYGAAAQPSTIDSAFVLGLTKELRSNKKPSFNANAGAGQYIWYCLPKRMGTCAFKVGGFDGGFLLVDTISFTNASGYTEDYYIYRSDNASLGSTSISVS